MAIHLPAPVAAFFDAKTHHDIAAILAPFAEDARVSDERTDHQGREAIRAWIEETQRKYADIATPEASFVDGDTIVVRATVSGTFPGSPILLTHRFKLAGDKIAELRIG